MNHLALARDENAEAIVARSYHMRSIVTSGCTAALLIAAIGGTWAITYSSTNPGKPRLSQAAINPFEMMLNAPALPVLVIVDPV